MGLIELSCSQCSTVFYGVLGRDTYCLLCKTIIDFRKAFELEDMAVAETDFNRVRDPKFEYTNMHNRKDWRNYIPEGIGKIWLQLPFEARVLAIMFAEREARAINIVSSVIAKEVK